MKMTYTCPECDSELTQFQMSYDNVEIIYHTAHFDPQMGYVDHDDKVYDLCHSGNSRETYTCPICFSDITEGVEELEKANWKEREGVTS